MQYSLLILNLQQFNKSCIVSTISILFICITSNFTSTPFHISILTFLCMKLPMN
nr:MAG TPA: hypothetical protein [Caudoviricetes sp.]